MSTTITGFNPSVDICATYLWSDPGSTNLNSDTSWFNKGSFSFIRYGATVGRLEDGSDIRVYTLLDTGAANPILHKRFYERFISPMMRQSTSILIKFIKESKVASNTSSSHITHT